MSSDQPNEQCGSFCSFLGRDLNEFMAHMLAHSLAQSDSTGPSNCNAENVANNVKAPTTSRMRPEKSGNSNLSLDTVTEDEGIMKGLSDKKKFSCDKCSFKARFKSSLHAHSRTHSSEKPFKCPNLGCDYKTRWAGALRGHQRWCRGQIQINTAETTDEVSIVAVVDRSRSEGTTEVSIESADLTEGKYLYGCTACSFIAYGKESLQRHLLVHTRRKPFRRPDSQHLSENSTRSASQCDPKNVDSFKAPRPKSNIRRIQPEKSLLTKMDFRCGNCSMTFGTKESLLRHQKIICPSELLLCDKCGYRTSFAQDWRNHVSIHSAGEQLKCGHLGCDYTTLCTQSLRKHQRSCKIRIPAPETSDGVAKSINILMEAVKIIEGKTEYSCSFCSFKSKYRSLLEGHFMTHVGRKTWRCGRYGCKYEAKSSQTLRHHIRRDHPRKAPKVPLQTKEHLGLHTECEIKTAEATVEIHTDSQNSLENSKVEESKLTLDNNDCNSNNPDKVQNETVVEVQRMMLRSGNCSFTTLNGETLDPHGRIHRREKTFKCPNPGCTFMTRWDISLQHHKRSCRDRIPIPAETFVQAAVDKTKTEGTTETRKQDDHQPFRCPIEGCKYLTELSSELRKHFRILHHMEVPSKTPLQTEENLGSEREMKIQGFVSTVGFACVFCEFIGFSELSALKHSCEHKTAVISLNRI